VVTRLEEEEREELFNNMNKMERSRIINLAEKHCAQMMDLIYRYSIPEVNCLWKHNLLTY
jgi:hypothetical protein